MDITQAAACILLAILAAFDLHSRRLPNVGVAAFAALFIAHASLGGASFAYVGAHVAVSGLTLLTTAVLFHLRWLGGGDAKLAAAVFLWSGPTNALAVLLVVSACGSLVAIGMIALRFAGQRGGRLSWLSTARGVPYGVALAVGGMLAVLLQPAHAEPHQISFSTPHADHAAPLAS